MTGARILAQDPSCITHEKTHSICIKLYDVRKLKVDSVFQSHKKMYLLYFLFPFYLKLPTADLAVNT